MKEKRIIVHLIRGEAKDMHERVTRNLTNQLGAFPIHDRTVPHLTLKRLFELDEAGLEDVYRVLDDFVLTHTQSFYRLHGLDHYDDRAIFVDVDASQQTLSIVSDLMKALHTIDDMTFDEYDEIQDDLHATVAMQSLQPFDFKETWDYLQSLKQMDFAMQFDNIGILKKENDKWIPDQVWELPMG